MISLAVDCMPSFSPRVVFASLINTRLPGVVIKIVAQARALREQFPEGEFHVFYSGRQDDLRLNNFSMPGLFFIRLPEFPARLASVLLPGFLSRYFQRLRPRVVILRSIPPSPLFWYAFRQRSYRLIVEYHTKLLPELLVSRDYKHFVMAAFSKGLVNRVIDGKVSMTREIALYEGSDAPGAVIANGIESKMAVRRPFKCYDGKCLRLVFVASENHPWQGLDRLIHSIIANEQACGPLCRLDVVGRIKVSDFPQIVMPSCVTFHGFMTSDAISELLGEADLGVSTLALYRKGMQEACALKSREYIMNTKPFIYGYRDPDIHNYDRFAMQVSNDDALLDMTSICKFASSIANNAEAVAEEMRCVAEERISWSGKIARYLAFAEAVLAMENRIV